MKVQGIVRCALLVVLVACAQHHGLGGSDGGVGGDDDGAVGDAGGSGDAGGGNGGGNDGGITGSDGGITGSDGGITGSGSGSGGDGSGSNGSGGSGSDGSDGSDGSATTGPCSTVSTCAASLGSSGDGIATGVAIDAAGNAYIVGFSGGTFAFGGETFYNTSARDAFVVSFTASGALRWAKRFGSPYPFADGLTEATGIALDADANVYIIGEQEHGVDFGGGVIGENGQFIASFDRDGNYRWARANGQGNPADDSLGGTGFGVAGTHVYMTVSFRGTLAFADVGVTLSSTDEPDVTEEPPVIAAAAFDTSDGHTLWTRQVDSADDMGSLAAGSSSIAFTTLEPYTDGTQTLYSWTPDGSDRWTAALDEGYETFDLSGLALDGSGDLYLAGMHDGDSDPVPGGPLYVDNENPFIHALDGSGASRWSWTLPASPGNADVSVTRVTFDPSGNVVVAGTIDAYANTLLYTGSGTLSVGIEGLFEAWYAPDGTPLGSRSFPDGTATSYENLQGIALDATGITWLVGGYIGTPNFGDGALAYEPESGILILRLAAP